MVFEFIPRISEVEAFDRSFDLTIRWRDGREQTVDLSDFLERFAVYRPLRDGSISFRSVRVGEFGADLVWTDEIDISADTLSRLATEQAVAVPDRAIVDKPSLRPAAVAKA